MPKSKVRKQKKKAAKNLKGKQKSNKKIYKKDGLEIVHEGKNVFMRNFRTPEQHAKFIEEVRQNRPKQLKLIESQIEKVETIFRDYDNLKLLGALAYNQFVQQSYPEDDGLSEVTLEYGLSFSTAISGNATVEPSPRIINELIKTLISIRHSYSGYVMSEDVDGKYTQMEGQIRQKVILESLYMRGNGYTRHIYEIYEELFLGHNDFLTEKYGFTASDILNTFRDLEDSFCCRVILPNGHPHPASYSRFTKWAKEKNEDEVVAAMMSGKHPIELFGEDNPDLIIKNSKVDGFRIDQIDTYPNLFKIRFKNETQKLIVAAISQSFGDNNEFLNPNYKGFPINDTLVTNKPIIEYNGEYYLFSFSTLTRRLFDITESLIATSDKKYYSEKYLGNKYAKSRDNFLELKTAELFRKIIPDSEFYPNLKYKPGQVDGKGNLIETELDLLVVSHNANYLIEMKAGGLSAPSRRGALKSLSGQLKDIVGYGAYQNYRALQYITNSPQPEFYDDTEVVYVDNSKKVFRITITLEHLADLIAYMFDLKELSVIDNEVDFAWTCSIFDLMIFSEIIDNEVDFIEYLEKRVPLYQRPELFFQDEIDVLGHFLKNSLVFDEELIHGLTNFQLYKYSEPIDAYFERRGAKPIRKQKVA